MENGFANLRHKAKLPPLKNNPSPCADSIYTLSPWEKLDCLTSGLRHDSGTCDPSWPEKKEQHYKRRVWGTVGEFTYSNGIFFYGIVFRVWIIFWNLSCIRVARGLEWLMKRALALFRSKCLRKVRMNERTLCQRSQNYWSRFVQLSDLSGLELYLSL